MKNKTVLDKIPMDQSSVYDPNGRVKKIPAEKTVFKCFACLEHKYKPEESAEKNLCKDCALPREKKEAISTNDPGDKARTVYQAELPRTDAKSD
jgi:hypothetical protein